VRTWRVAAGFQCSAFDKAESMVSGRVNVIVLFSSGSLGTVRRWSLFSRGGQHVAGGEAGGKFRGRVGVL